MKKIYITNYFLSFLVVVLITSVIFTGCKKNLNDAGANNIPFPPDLTTKVNSSVSGFVTDENNQAVNLATVQVGALTITTDKYGYFQANNVDVVKDAAVVTVTKTGYFKGIKTYIASAGKAAFFRIKLIPKTNTGTVNGGTGGAMTLANSLSITFPAGSIVNAATNVAYTGTVNVSAYWINPTSTDLPNIMPGDLRGINTAGNLQLLTTYGMAAVELTGSGGELLQIAAGKKATLSLPIPSALAAAAPATIPLWYFDEAKGLWKQEGTATKTGSNYVGEVSHFSFWNCDVPNNYVQFNCTVVNSGGQPIQNAIVKISVVSNPANFRYDFTNSSGYVSGTIPDNAQLLLEIFNTISCSTPAYSQTFTTTNVNISLGTITITNATAQATITGTVTNCSNGPVSNGYIIIQTGNINNRIPLNNSGTYSFNLLICSNTNINITLIGEDVANAQQSIPVVHSIIPGNNTIPNIQACGVSIQQYIYYSLNGGPIYSYLSPVDNFSHQLVVVSGQTATLQDLISGQKPNPNNNYTSIRFLHDNIAQGSNQQLTAFYNPQIDSFELTVPNPVMVNITEYGPAGQFISGNFSGALRGSPPTNTIYNIVCSFRVRN